MRKRENTREHMVTFRVTIEEFQLLTHAGRERKFSSLGAYIRSVVLPAGMQPDQFRARLDEAEARIAALEATPATRAVRSEDIEWLDGVRSPGRPGQLDQGV